MYLVYAFGLVLKRLRTAMCMKTWEREKIRDIERGKREEIGCWVKKKITYYNKSGLMYFTQHIIIWAFFLTEWVEKVPGFHGSHPE